MKKRIIASLAIAILLVQIFCMTALAEGTPAVNITLDTPTRTVTLKGTGFAAGEVSILAAYNEAPTFLNADYINQVTADSEGKFEITFPSAKDSWTAGDTYNVAVQGVVYTAAVTQTTAAIAIENLVTSNIVATYAANIKLKATALGFVPDAPIVVTLKDVAGTVYGSVTVGENGEGILKASALPVAGTYKLIATCGSVTSEADLVVVPVPANLWAPKITVSGTSTSVEFSANISPKTQYVVKVNGAVVGAPTQTGNTLTFDGAVANGDKVVISGVKYADLFQSYTFTFTITYAAS